MKINKLCALALIFFVFPLQAIKIRFPDEELASETVLPVFDPTQTILNRNVSLKYRFEVGGGAKFGLDEPFYFPAYGVGHISFYLTEVHGVSLTATYFPPFLSKSGGDLRGGICDLDRVREKGISCGDPAAIKVFDVQKLPYPQIMGFINYQYTPYYGKISLTKKIVMNLSIYGFVGPGLIVLDENTKLFAFNMGIGQRFYFTRFLALKTDVGFYSYYGPDPPKIKVFCWRNECSPPGQGKIPFNRITPQEKTLHLHLTASVGAAFLL